MKIIKKILITFLSLIITVVLLVVFYLFADTTLGIIALGSGYALLFAVFILTIVGLIKGNVKFLDIEGRFNFMLILTYTLVTSASLLITWSVNYQLQEELGSLSVSDKLGLISGDYWFNDKKIQSFTRDYPVREVEHITFKYHPDTEKQVKEMAAVLERMTQMESNIYGRVIEKSVPLEVSVLRSANDYNQLNPNIKSADAGLYNATNKQAIVYHNATGGSGDDLFVIETFIHEYSHYLFDLFLEEEGINMSDVPVWFNEGIAEYMRTRIVSNLRLTGDLDQDYSYIDLHTQNSWNKAREDADVYYQALLGIEYIIGQKGNLSALSEILLAQKETGSFTQSFDHITGLDLARLHQTISSVEHRLSEAWHTWALELDYEKAGSIYKEIIDKTPYHRKVWHHQALMYEDQKVWDGALAARREYNRISPDSTGFLNTSQLLLLTDPKEALDMAHEALKAAKQEPNGYVAYNKQWVEDVKHYNLLMTEENYVEAYDWISQSEHLSSQLSIIEELADMKSTTIKINNHQ